mgnify:CR=1 FL=1
MYLNPSQSAPSYIHLHHQGLLQHRAETALAHLSQCEICPRECGAERDGAEAGCCCTERYARVVSYFPHRGEEKCLSGHNGSGTIFFAGCNLGCVFCQNSELSQGDIGVEVTPQRLGEMMLELQELGCHNINFVTPSHVVPQILEALPYAIQGGLNIPLVYNSSGYDRPDTLRLLEGVIDIYLPDFKLWDESRCELYLNANNYRKTAQAAVREMYRQVGSLRLDEHGLAQQGLLVRHLLMPDALEDTGKILRFLAEAVSTETYINLMDQYYPAGQVSAQQYAEIDRCIQDDEKIKAMHLASRLGLYRLDSLN